MYFRMKNILKINCYHTFKYLFKDIDIQQLLNTFLKIEIGYIDGG